jgi:hypothetical protein
MSQETLWPGFAWFLAPMAKSPVANLQQRFPLEDPEPTPVYGNTLLFQTFIVLARSLLSKGHKP